MKDNSDIVNIVSDRFIGLIEMFQDSKMSKSPLVCEDKVILIFRA